MTVVARKIAACPARSATEAWNVIVNLLAPVEDSAAYTELLKLTGLASSLIADEALTAPLVCFGDGPRVRVYCVYGEDALAQENVNAAPLAFNPTDGDWKISLPCGKEDLDWVQKSLKKYSERVTARDLSSAVEEDATEKAMNANSAEIKREAFLQA